MPEIFPGAKDADKLGCTQFDDYNSFVPLLNKTIKALKCDIDAKALKSITDAITGRMKKPNPSS